MLQNCALSRHQLQGSSATKSAMHASIYSVCLTAVRVTMHLQACLSFLRKAHPCCRVDQLANA